VLARSTNDRLQWAAPQAAAEPTSLHHPFLGALPVKVDADAQIVMFSLQRECSHVTNHMIEKVTT
jgi:hypothetical protein